VTGHRQPYLEACSGAPQIGDQDGAAVPHRLLAYEGEAEAGAAAAGTPVESAEDRVTGGGRNARTGVLYGENGGQPNSVNNPRLRRPPALA
jgi:hypothetical protein